MGRPRTLTQGDFITAALRIVDAEGLEALSFRRLGAEMGVSYTAAYTYFESRQDLLEALAGKVVAEAFASVDVSDPTPRGRLIAVAVGLRAGLVRHPRALPAFLVSTREPPGASAVVAAVIEILEQAGLSGEDLTLAYRALEGYVFGLTVFDVGAAPEHLELRRRRYEAIPHPDFRPLGRSQASMRDHNEQAFRRGIEVLLDGFGI